MIKTRLQQSRAELLLPGWWEGGPGSTSSSTRRPGIPSTVNTRPSSSSSVARPRHHAGTLRRAQPGRAEAARGQRQPTARVQRRDHERSVQGVDGRFTLKSRPRTLTGRRSTTTIPSSADQNLWFRFTEARFDRFMQSQSCNRFRTTQTQPARRKPCGPFHQPSPTVHDTYHESKVSSPRKYRH